MPIESIHPAGAPTPAGPYSPGIAAGGFVFCSGQTGRDPQTGVLAPGGVADQTRQVLRNLEVVLQAAGLGLADVVKTTVFLTDMDDFDAMNEAYAAVFGGHRPARTTVEVSRLPRGGLVEIECIALKRA